MNLNISSSCISCWYLLRLFLLSASFVLVFSLVVLVLVKVEVVVAVLLPSAAVVGFEHSYKPKNLLPLPKRVVFLFFVAFGFLFGLYDL